MAGHARAEACRQEAEAGAEASGSWVTCDILPIWFRADLLRRAALIEVQRGGNPPPFLLTPEERGEVERRNRRTGLSQRALRWVPAGYVSF